MIYMLEILLSLFISVKFTVSGIQSTSPSNSSDYQYDLHLSRSSREVKSVIYIGVILTDEDKNIGRAFENGVQAANEVLSQSGTLSSYQLEPIIQFVPKDNIFKATQQACKILDRGIIALYGPSSTSLAQALLSLANRFGLPYVETHWSMVQSKTTYAIHLHPSIESYGLGLYEYLTQVEKWKRMTLIYNKPESLLKFTTLVNNFEGILKIKSWDENASGARAMMAELGSGLEKNFLVDIPSWQVANFLVMAYVHNMTGYQYTFIFTDWDIATIDLSAFKIDVGARIKAVSIIPKVTLLDINKARQPEMSFYRKLPEDVSSNIIPNGNPTIQFSLIYDSLVLLAHGLCTVTRTRPLLPQKLSCERPPGLWPLGLSLINAVQSVASETVRGLTSPFRFDKHGLRTLFDLTTLELTQGGFKPTGVWNIDERMKVAKQPAITLPKQLPKIKGVVLKVTTIPDAPFMIPIKFDAYDRPLGTPDAWMGYCIDLLNHIASDVGFNYTVHITPDRQYGSGMDFGNGTIFYNGIMGELIREEADMAVAGFTITYEREKLVDFSTPWMTLGGSILFTRPKSQKPSLFSFLQPLSPQVWLYVGFTYLAVCLCLFVAARLSPHEWTATHPCEVDGDTRKNQFTLLNSFYYNVSALLNQGTELAPHATSTRLLTGVWWFFALIIIATYTANLAAFLTVENMKSPIESAEDLANQEKIKYGTLKSGSSRDFFRTSSLPTFKKMGEFMDKYPDATVSTTQEGIERVLQGNYAFILESTWNEYYAQRDCRLTQVGTLLDSKGYGIGFPQGSPWRDPVSKSILKLQNAQILAKLKRIWWNEFNITEPCSLLRESGKAPSPLGVEQVGGVFIVLLIGFFMGFAVSIIEFLVATRDQQKTAVWRGMWKELKFATRCLTTSRRLRSDIPKLSRSRSSNRLISSVPNNLSAINNSPNSLGFSDNHKSNVKTNNNNNISSNIHMGGTNLKVELDTSRDQLLNSELKPFNYEQQNQQYQERNCRTDRKITSQQCASLFDQSDASGGIFGDPHPQTPNTRQHHPKNIHSFQQLQQHHPYIRSETDAKRFNIQPSVVRSNLNVEISDMNEDSELWQVNQSK
ncbi:hypothetical protein MN116_001159 [Schistosoma mekongi]|uniref:Uncharacterized protein n=1 Tax=Schistosoma mekongi TaxID=38744 RepID=A0AAE2D943_SCHME|nr:hypothetical protein MN116_001159 [Schistosoma mekongi]